jgi:hypothetical protein
VLNARHYTYKCMKLMPHKEVFLPHFPFYLLYLHKRQAKNVSYNTEVHLCNHSCSRITINITNPKVCVFVDLCIHHAKRKLYTVIYNQSGCTIFFHIISSQRHDYWRRGTERRKNFLQIKCVLIFLKRWNFSHSKKTWASNNQNINLSSSNARAILVWFSKKESFMKSCQLGDESFQADRHDAGNSVFHNFTNAPNYGMHFNGIC